MSLVPKLRIDVCNKKAIRSDGEFVLYWMIAFRRVEWNFALQRAVELATELKKPLVIFEPLRVDYRWASNRLHRFVIDGMAENAKRVAEAKNHGISYFPYVERERGASKGLLAALARRACAIVTDDYPAFFLPRMVSAAARQVPVLMEKVDSNGLLPLRATDRVFTTAHSFRTFLQKELPSFLEQFPDADSLRNAKLPPTQELPAEITDQWPAASEQLLGGDAVELSKLPIDHKVEIVDYRGGRVQARKLLHEFLESKLSNSATGANHPDEDTRSGLSPYLHFGHLSTHEMFHELMASEEWKPDHLSPPIKGKREGWWNVSPGAEAWLDEFITWREIGFNMSHLRDDYDNYESLPEWARETLEDHADDKREHVYSLEEFAEAETNDPIWNAAQRQLVREGRMHNYLRMLWGKKILEWTASPREAIDVMVELNNRYAVDGRDPNSYSGIFWCLGRYDRAWGPERPIFGKVRYMSSESTRKKLRLQEYLKNYGES